MAKNLIISILAVFLVSTAVGSAIAGGSKSGKPLRDGFFLAGIDGKLTQLEVRPEGAAAAPGDLLLTGLTSTDRWFFEFDSDVSDGKGRICAGTSVELLPSAALEKMTADVKKHSNASYRLWGRVTRYEDKNFIFPIYFLPISKTNKLESSTSQRQESKVTINEPNDAIPIPQEIIKKLATRRIVRTEQLREGLKLKTDCILADRTGFIRDSEHGAQGRGHEVSFVLDALGRNVPKISFPLLPCRALERAQRK